MVVWMPVISSLTFGHLWKGWVLQCWIMLLCVVAWSPDPTFSILLFGRSFLSLTTSIIINTNDNIFCFFVLTVVLVQIVTDWISTLLRILCWAGYKRAQAWIHIFMARRNLETFIYLEGSHSYIEPCNSYGSIGQSKSYPRAGCFPLSQNLSIRSSISWNVFRNKISIQKPCTWQCR